MPSRNLRFKMASRSKASRSSGSSRIGRTNRTSIASQHSDVRAVSGPGSVSSQHHLDHPRPSARQAESHNTSPGALEDDATTEIDNNDDDILSEVIMAIDMTLRGTVGCCYYVAREEKLYFMEDIQIGDVNTVDTLKTFIGPTVVLLSIKASDSVINLFDPEAKSGESASSTNDPFRLPFLLDIRPSGEFCYDAAKTKLMTLRLGEIDGTQLNFVVPGDHVAAHDDDAPGQQCQLLRLAGWIDVESRVTVGCAGALLSYLQRRRAAAYLPGDRAAHMMFRVTTLEMFSLRDKMFINADTLRSLGIIDAEAHPHSHNRGPNANSGAKEGLSVYGLFHHLARTPQGKCLLRQRFMRPSLDIDAINERLDAVSVFSRLENAPVFDALVQHLRNVGNMRVIAMSVRKGISGPAPGRKSLSRSVWTSVREFAFHALRIKDVLQDVIGGDNIAIRNKILQNFEGYHLAQIGRKISETVDFDKSDEERRTVILPGVDEELDHMKRTLDGLESILSQVATRLSEAMPAELRAALNVIYFPQIGFLVIVPMDPLTGAAVYDGSLEKPWEMMFSADDQVYFKTSEVREMDNHFGDVYGMISDREIEISHELAQYMLQYEGLFTTCSDMCGELDSLLALAQGAKKYNLVRPRMTLENIVQIEQGRHILQEQTVTSFVPNDTLIVGGKTIYGSDADQQYISYTSPQYSSENSESGPSMLVLTGPNYSGKSIYLKQVALIVFMAHVGSFVPAASAKIGLTDKILSRVTTRETVSRAQSAFMIDLQQISLALNLATRRSLLIIDEFGKEIFEMGLLSSQPSLAFGHLEVKVDSEKSQVDDQITYLYNFREGRSTSSFGTCCAALNGVPGHIVRRAEDLILLSIKGANLVVACCQMPEDEAAELEEAVRQMATIFDLANIDKEQIAKDFLNINLNDEPKASLSDIFTVSAVTDSHS
ncbi:MutS protein msh5 [Curvularia kusanoi]|uniref:MutS protein msh5 n=1 Tax=Curvularia kusanoi TaxID=90978 RepID=A0A9P4TCE7_CURKU|nr:MutS protein msh5 [Curvularia kusanoi]